MEKKKKNRIQSTKDGKLRPEKGGQKKKMLEGGQSSRGKKKELGKATKPVGRGVCGENKPKKKAGWR